MFAAFIPSACIPPKNTTSLKQCKKSPPLNFRPTAARSVDFDLVDNVPVEKSRGKFKGWVKDNLLLENLLLEKKHRPILGLDVHRKQYHSISLTFGVSTANTFIYELDRPTKCQKWKGYWTSQIFEREDITVVSDPQTADLLEILGLPVPKLVTRQILAEDCFGGSRVGNMEALAEWPKKLEESHRLYSRTKAVWLSVWAKS